MPKEIINGIECVFPVSKEESFNKFGNMVLNALYKEVLEGRISQEELDNILKEDGGTKNEN